MSRHHLDLLVVLTYLVAILVVGAWSARRRARTTTDYFLGGRNFTWPFVGMSLFASSISSMQFVGQAGLAYQIGIAAANPQLLGAGMLGFSAIFFAPVFVRSRICTIPELLELRYSRAAKLVFSITILTVGLLLSPFGFYAGGLAILQILGVDPRHLWLCCLAMGAVLAVYTILGGLASEMVMDFVQGTILLLGGTIVLVGGWLHLAAQPPPSLPFDHLSLVLPASDPHMPWTGVFSGLLLASLFFATTNAGLLQRVLTARDVSHARNGLLFAAVLKILAVFVIVFPGVIAARLFPGINPDAAFPTLVGELLPPGVSGLVLAAMIAALMSTADTGVNNLSSMVALNIYPLFAPRASDRQALLVGRVSAATVLLGSVLVAPWVGNLGLIFPLTLKISAYLLGPVGVCYLLGRFSKRVNNAGALTVLALGYGVGLYLVVATTVKVLAPLVPDVIVATNFYHVSAGLVALYALLLGGISLLTAPPPYEKVAWLQAAKRPDEPTGPIAWYHRFSFRCGLLFALLAALYAIF